MELRLVVIVQLSGRNNLSQNDRVNRKNGLDEFRSGFGLNGTNGLITYLAL